MTTPFVEAWRTIVPRSDDPHGPLPPLLLTLTVVTGLVDAFSYLTLDHVFVANMTGNVVFLGFALAGARGFSVAASSLALGSFAVGSLLGGRLVVVITGDRGRLLAFATSIQVVLVAAATVVRIVVGSAGSSAGHYLADLPARRFHGTAERNGSEGGCARPHDDRTHVDDHRHLC